MTVETITERPNMEQLSKPVPYQRRLYCHSAHVFAREWRTLELIVVIGRDHSHTFRASLRARAHMILAHTVDVQLFHPHA